MRRRHIAVDAMSISLGALLAVPPVAKLASLPPFLAGCCLFGALFAFAASLAFWMLTLKPRA